MSLEELLCTRLWKMSFEMSLDGLSLLLKEWGRNYPPLLQPLNWCWEMSLGNWEKNQKLIPLKHIYILHHELLGNAKAGDL